MTSTATHNIDDFAAKNHGLIYSFLKSRNLDPEEYYGICAIGFSIAVEDYFSLESMKSLKFSTIAYKAMRRSLGEERKRTKAKKRTCNLISIYDSPDAKSAPIINTYHVPDRLWDLLETELLMHDLAAKVSKKQMSVIQLRIQGYSMREIGKKVDLKTSEVSEMLDDLFDVVVSVCQQ